MARSSYLAPSATRAMISLVSLDCKAANTAPPASEERMKGMVTLSAKALVLMASSWAYAGAASMNGPMADSSAMCFPRPDPEAHASWVCTAQTSLVLRRVLGRCLLLYVLCAREGCAADKTLDDRPKDDIVSSWRSLLSI